MAIVVAGEHSLFPCANRLIAPVTVAETRRTWTLRPGLSKTDVTSSADQLIGSPGKPSSMHRMLFSLSLNHAALPMSPIDATSPFQSTSGMS